MKKLKLTRGKFALLDDEDFERASEFKWYVAPHHGGWRACRTIRWPDGRQTTQFLSRFILGLDFGDRRQVDHINGDQSDDQRANLRIVTNRQNHRNRTCHRNGKEPNIRYRPDCPKHPWEYVLQIADRIFRYWNLATKEEALFLRKINNEIVDRWESRDLEVA